MITQTDVDNIRKSWSYIMEDDLNNMLKFYNRLFEIAPHIRMHFPDNMSKLANKLSHTLNLLVTNVERFDSLKPTLEELGRMHRKIGVENYHYKYVVEALVYTVKQVMAENYHKEIGTSWNRVLIAVATIMINAPEKKSGNISGIFKKLFN